MSVVTYSLTATKSDTRLSLFHYEGKRRTEDATELFKKVEEMRNASSPIPVFISDDWDAFEEGFINVYGKIELLQYKGIGRKPLPKLIPFEGAHPKTLFNLIIAAKITTPKYDISLISYLGNTFLHDSIQLKNLSTTLFFFNLS